MAAVANVFDLLEKEDGGLPVPAPSSKKKDKSKRKKQKQTIAAEGSTTESTAADSSQHAVEDEEDAGFQTVGKGGAKGKSLTSKKSTEYSLPRETGLRAAQARLEAEGQAASPLIQFVVEDWLAKADGEVSAQFLEQDGSLITFKQVLASSCALEVLFSTCLRERIDADLQLLDLLQKVFPGAAEGMVEALVSALVSVAQTVDVNSPDNLVAAEQAVRAYLALLKAESVKPSEEGGAKELSRLDSEIAAKQSSATSAANLRQHITTAADILRLEDAKLDLLQGKPSTSDPVESAEQSLTAFKRNITDSQRGASAREAALEAEGSRLTQELQGLHHQQEELRAQLEALGVQIAKIHEDQKHNKLRQEQPEPQLDTAAYQKQLRAIDALEERLAASKPIPNGTMSHDTSLPDLLAPYSAAAQRVLELKLRQMAEAATKANFARSRLASVNMQLQHLRRQGKEQSKDIQDAMKRRQQHTASLEESRRSAVAIKDSAQEVISRAKLRKMGGESLAALESLTQQIQEQFAALEAGPLPAPGPAAPMPAPIANGTVGSPSSSSAPEEASSQAGGQVAEEPAVAQDLVVASPAAVRDQPRAAYKSWAHVFKGHQPPTEPPAATDAAADAPPNTNGVNEGALDSQPKPEADPAAEADDSSVGPTADEANNAGSSDRLDDSVIEESSAAAEAAFPLLPSKVDAVANGHGAATEVSAKPKTGEKRRNRNRRQKQPAGQ